MTNPGIHLINGNVGSELATPASSAETSSTETQQHLRGNLSNITIKKGHKWVAA